MQRMIIVAGSVFALYLGTLAFAADDKGKTAPKEPSTDTAKAAATRKKMQEKVTLKLKNEQLKNIIDEIKDQIKDLSIQADTKGGISMNKKMTIECDKVTLEEALDKLLKPESLGYIIVSNSANAYDGSILIRMGDERGYPKDAGKK